MNGTTTTQTAAHEPALAVLMYHAVQPDAGPCPGGAEPNYTVTRGGFAQQLQMLEAAGRRAGSVARHLAGLGSAGPQTLLTFDDGHASNAFAAELLAGQGGSADFFVNPSTVGQPDFLSWPALREMAAMGMSIQSHGMHHRYLDQLSPQEVERELVDSKAEIEARIGSPVTLFAPPGGRQSQGLAEVARRAGYQRICSSRAAYWQPGQPGPDGIEIPRLAVLSATADAQFGRWIALDPDELAWQQRRYRALRLAKGLLGNRSYDAVRGVLLRLAARRGA